MPSFLSEIWQDDNQINYGCEYYVIYAWIRCNRNYLETANRYNPPSNKLNQIFRVIQCNDSNMKKLNMNTIVNCLTFLCEIIVIIYM